MVDKTDDEHINDMVMEHAPTIHYQANALKAAGKVPSHVEEADLHAAGWHGLLEAFKSYDPKLANFNTWASSKVKNKMLEHIGGTGAIDQHHYRKARIARMMAENEAKAKAVQSQPAPIVPNTPPSED